MKKVLIKTILILAVLMLVACGSTLVKKDFGLPENQAKIGYTEKWLPKETIRFLVLGDTQNLRTNESQNHQQRRAIFDDIVKALSDSINGIDLVFHTGDFVDQGGKESLWNKYFDDIFWNNLTTEQKKRFFPAIGNHEYKPHFLGSGAGNLKFFYQRFSHIKDHRYYFFVYGNSCFIVMDSGKNGIMKVLRGERWENGVGEQIEWLNRVVFPHLARASEEIENIFVFFHKPGYATPVYRRNKKSAKILAMFENFNQKNGDQFRIICFTGHIHTFSHIYKDYNNDGRNGIHQFTCGCGGGTQRGKEYFQKIKSVEDLDLYRKQKYNEKIREDNFNQDVFDHVRFDNNIFGYLEVLVNDKVTIKFHRFDENSSEFYVDYDTIVNLK